MFHKAITLNRVRDHVKVREGSDSIDLTVDGDPYRMVTGLNEAMDKMKAVPKDADAETVTEAAMFFAGVIFGEEQAAKLLAFYKGQAECVVGVCGQYLAQRLAKLIEKAQKK